MVGLVDDWFIMSIKYRRELTPMQHVYNSRVFPLTKGSRNIQHGLKNKIAYLMDRNKVPWIL
jgi:hypothetical protein